jgi:hypothetical protein
VESDDDSDVTTEVTQYGKAPGIPATIISDSSRVPLPENALYRMDRIVDVGKVGPDTSIGKSNEIYETSIHVEPEVLKILCPKGVSQAVRKELMETATDVVALPGKLGGTDASFVWDQFAGAVCDLTDLGSRRAGNQPRDTQWKIMSRNALDKIKTIDDLSASTEELSGQRDKVLSNMEAAMREVLFNAGWTKEDADVYCEAGLLPRIIRRSMTIYYELHIHFQTVAMMNPEAWEDCGKMHVDHHAKQLRQIRMYAARRSQMILQTYTYLRDAKAKGFQDIKLLGAITQKLQDVAFKNLAVTPRPPKAPKEWHCTHCHSDLHEGGMKDCSLKEFKAKVARRLARDAKSDPDALETLMAEERKKPSP